MLSPFFKQAWISTGVLANIAGIGIMSTYPYSLTKGLMSPGSDITTDVQTASWLASCVGISGIFGFFISSFLMERWGRKFAHFITMIPGVIGWLVIYFAKNVLSLIIGRILCGLSCGCTVILGAVVIGEYSSPENRGLFLNFKTTALYIGTISLHITAQYNDWRTVALYSEIPYLLAFINNLTWPESPSWLASKHRFEESKKSFFWLRGTSEASMAEFEALIKQQNNVVKTDVKLTRQIVNVLKKFTQKNFLKPLLIIFFGFSLLEAGGRHYLANLAMDIIKRISNETDNTKSFYYVLAMDFIIVIGCSISSVLVKLIKRKTLLFLSGISCLIVMSSLIVFLYLARLDVIVNDKPWIPLSMLALYLLLLNLGCTPIPLAWLGELFPLEHKSFGTAVSGMVTSLSLVLTLKTAPLMLVYIDVEGLFLVYAIIMFVCLFYLYFTLPETRNRTLLEIEDFFNYGRFLDEEKNNVAGIKMLKQDHHYHNLDVSEKPMTS